MQSKFLELMKRPMYRYLVVGGGVYVFELAVIVIAQLAGAGPVLAVALSYILGTTVSFILQKFVTFGDKRTHHKIVIPQLLATSTLVLFNFGFTLLVAKVMAHHIPTIISRTLALGITTIWNFYLYKTRIFKNSDTLID